MQVKPSRHVPQQPVSMEGSQGCKVRWLVGEGDGAPTFAMREFEVEPDGHTPRHFHPYEHEVFILEGSGVVYEGDLAHPLRAGDVVFIQPDEVHQFRNTGLGPMRFLCLIPNTATSHQVTVVPECGLDPSVP